MAAEHIDRGMMFHASVFGGCLHAQVLALQGVEPEPLDQETKDLFAWGHESEERVKQAMRDAGFMMSHDASDYGSQTRVRFETWIPNGADAHREKIMLRAPLDGILHGFSREDKARPLSALNGLAYTEDLWRAAGFLWGPPSPGMNSVLEHKSTTTEKFDCLLAALRLGQPPTPGIIADRYEWQTSAQAWACLEETLVRDPQGVMTIEERREDNSPGRCLAIPVFPKYSKAECLARCGEVIRLYKAGIVPECDSEFGCPYISWDAKKWATYLASVRT